MKISKRLSMAREVRTRGLTGARPAPARMVGGVPSATRPRSLASFVALSLAIMLLAACGGGQDGGQGGSGGSGGGQEDGATGGGTVAEGPPIRDIDEIVTASDKTALAGRRVRLKNVKIIEVTKTGLGLVVGTDIEQGVAVLIPPSARTSQGGSTNAEQTEAKAPELESGQSVNVRGIIRETPANYDNAVRDYGLKRKQFALLQDHEIFVLSPDVEPAES